MTDSFDDLMNSIKATSAIPSMDEISKQLLSSSYITYFDNTPARAAAIGTTSALDEAFNSIKSSALGGSLSSYFDESINNYTSSLLKLNSHDELLKLACGFRNSYQEIEILTKVSTKGIQNLHDSFHLEIKTITDSISEMKSFQSFMDSIMKPERLSIAIDALTVNFTAEDLKNYDKEEIEEQITEAVNTDSGQDFVDKLKDLPNSIKAILGIFVMLVILPIINSITANLITPHIKTLLESMNKPEREQVKEISSIYHRDVDLSQLRFVTVNALNLRAKPKIRSEILDVLKLGQVLNVLNRENSWIEVSFTNEEKEIVTGWVLARYTEKFKYY